MITIAVLSFVNRFSELNFWIPSAERYAIADVSYFLTGVLRLGIMFTAKDPKEPHDDFYRLDRHLWAFYMPYRYAQMNSNVLKNLKVTSKGYLPVCRQYFSSDNVTIKIVDERLVEFGRESRLPAPNFLRASNLLRTGLVIPASTLILDNNRLLTPKYREFQQIFSHLIDDQLTFFLSTLMRLLIKNLTFNAVHMDRNTGFVETN